MYKVVMMYRIFVHIYEFVLTGSKEHWWEVQHYWYMKKFSNYGN